jgi:hypothetical protein
MSTFVCGGFKAYLKGFFKDEFYFILILHSKLLKGLIVKKCIIIGLLFAHSSCRATEDSLLDRVLCSWFGIIVAPKDTSKENLDAVLTKIQTRACTAKPVPKPAPKVAAKPAGKEVEEVVFKISEPKLPFFTDKKFCKRLAER